jgi:hypothetical protein
MADAELVEVFRQGPEVWGRQLNQVGTIPYSRSVFDFSGEDFTGVSPLEGFSFPKQAIFDGCVFATQSIHLSPERGISFREATFKKPMTWLILGTGRADFSGAKFEAPTTFVLHKDQVMPQFVGKSVVFSDAALFTNITFKILDFTEAHFFGEANFQNCKFGASTSFLRAQFYKAPNFHNAELHQDIQFNPANALEEQFIDKTSLEAERTFRTLKLQMHKAQAVSEELAFARLELKAKASRENWRSAWLYRLYDETSDYGQSTRRPFSTFVLLTLIAWFVAISQRHSEISAFDSSLLAFVLSNSLPFVGGLKAFGPEHLKDVFEPASFWLLQLLAVLQSLGSAICIFLFGLAVRNKLRLRG